MGYKLAFASELEDLIRAKCAEEGWDVLGIDFGAGSGTGFDLKMTFVAPRREKT